MRINKIVAVTVSALTLALCFGSAASTTVKADDYVANPWAEYFARLEASNPSNTPGDTYSVDHDANNEDGDCISNPWANSFVSQDSEDGDYIANPWFF